MIENIQKYRGVLIVAFVVAAVAFVFGDYTRSTRNGGGGGVPTLRISGDQYNDIQVVKEGEASYELCFALAQSGDMSFYQFLMEMSGNSMEKDQGGENFFAHRIILRQAQEQFGIYPTEEKITAYIKGLRAFAGPDEKFDAERYKMFVERGMGRKGLIESDLRLLVSDLLVSQSLKSIVGGGLPDDRASLATQMRINNQKITAEMARLQLAPFAEKIQPTDEEVKAYWQVISDAFKTEPKRKFTYVIVTPAAPTLPIEETVPALPENATAEQKEEAAKQADAKKAATEAATAAAKAQEQRKVDALVDDFLFNLAEKKGTGFEELAKANGWEIKTTDFFPASAVPAELDVALRSSNSVGKASQALFNITQTSDPFSKISEGLPIGENQWLIARLDGEETSRSKTYEEARDEARKQYISEKASEAMKAAATESATKIKTSLAAGKSFSEAATEAGITDVITLPPVTRIYRPTQQEPQELFGVISAVDPGSITEPLIEGTNAFIVYVAKREVPKDPTAEASIDSELARRTQGNESIAFVAWLTARIEAANVQKINR